jgi:hypothetical protein
VAVELLTGEISALVFNWDGVRGRGLRVSGTCRTPDGTFLSSVRSAPRSASELVLCFGVEEPDVLTTRSMEEFPFESIGGVDFMGANGRRPAGSKGNGGRDAVFAWPSEDSDDKERARLMRERGEESLLMRTERVVASGRFSGFI